MSEAATALQPQVKALEGEIMSPVPQTALAQRPSPALVGLLAESPEELIALAISIATPLAKLIDDKTLYSMIRTKKYVKAEGWMTLLALLGVAAREKPGSARKIDDDTWEVYVELVRLRDGQSAGGASHICSRKENNWK